MSTIAKPSQFEWRKQLPVSVVDWVEQDLCRSFADITQISVKLECPPLDYQVATVFGWKTLKHPTHTSYAFTFTDGNTFEANHDPLSQAWVTTLIDGYQDIISPHLWLDRYIRQVSTENGFHNYHMPDNAYNLAAHILQRGESDPLCLCFARKLVTDVSVSDDALLMLVKMEMFATSYNPTQICTAAYQAYYEAMEHSNGRS